MQICAGQHTCTMVADAYTRRLVFGEHSPGVIVQVMFVGGMFCLTKAINKVWRQTSGHLDEHFRKGQSWYRWVPAETSNSETSKGRKVLANLLINVRITM